MAPLPPGVREILLAPPRDHRGSGMNSSLDTTAWVTLRDALLADPAVPIEPPPVEPVEPTDTFEVVFEDRAE